MDNTNNMTLFEQLRTTPQEARKEIAAGRLKGFTDINPMWRFKRLTEVFGPCGIGWKYEIVSQRLQQGNGCEIAAFVDVLLYYKWDGQWSEGIPGIGGSAFVAAERSGPHTSDECFKMALTDAIGTACKALGMSADIYFQKDRTKYNSQDSTPANGNQSNGYVKAPTKEAPTPTEEEMKVYKEAVQSGMILVDGLTDAASANATAPYLKQIKHALSSEREVIKAWNAKIKNLGLIYDKVLKEYTNA